MVTNNTSSQDGGLETQPEESQTPTLDTSADGDTGLTTDTGDLNTTTDGADSTTEISTEGTESTDNRSFSQEEFSKLQSAEHKNQAKLQQEVQELRSQLQSIESKNKESELKQTVDMVEVNKVRYAEKLTNDLVDQGYDQNAAKRMAYKQAEDEASIYLQRLEINQEKSRLEEQRTKNQQENRLTTKHKIASTYGIDANQLDVFSTPEQMENYAKLAGKLVETGNQLVDSSPTHNSAESVSADGSPQNDQSLIQKYLRGDRSEAASGAVKRMMGR